MFAALNMRPNEASTAGLLLLNSLLNGLARVLVGAAAAAIFLDSQPIEAIPYVYMALGVVGGTVGLLIARAEAALPYTRFLPGLLAFAAAVTVALWLATTVGEAPWAPFATAVWGNLVESFVALVVGAVAGHALDLRQAKRLYPVVGSGETVAEIAGGLGMPLLVALVGARGLLVVVVGCLIGGFLVTRYVLATRRPEEPDAAAAEPSEQPSASPLALLRSGYLRLVLVIAALDVFYFFSLEAGFWAETQARFGDADEIASFFGLATGTVAVVTLLVRALVASRVLRRWGLAAGLVAGPAIALPSVLAVVVVGLVAPDAAALFWLFVVARLSYDVTYAALYTPSFQVLFEGLPLAERLRAFASYQVIAEPVLTGLSGVFLLALMALFPLGAFSVAVASIAMLLLWIAAGLIVRRAYVDVLRRTLGKRLIGHTSLTLGDATSLGVLEDGLRSAHAGAVLFALHKLEQAAHWDATPWLAPLLDHGAAEVREEALRRVERLRLRTLEASVRARALDPAPAVRAAAVRALAAIVGEDDADAVAAYLSHDDRAVRRGALVGLVLHGGFAGFVAAGEALLRLRASADPADRVLVADALGEIGAPPIVRPLERLLEDPDAAVRRAALKAAGRIGSPVVWPAAVRALEDPAAREAAAAALVAGGASAVPAVMAAFDAPEAGRDLRRRAIAVVARIADPAATGALAERLEYQDQPLRHQIVRALAARGFRAEGGRREAAWRLVAAELSAAAWTLASIGDLAGSPAAWLLRRTLELEVGRGRERVLWLLTFVDPREPVLDAVRGLESDAAERRDYAAEVLDNVIASELKGALLALVEPDEPRAQLARFGPMFRQPSLDPSSRLREIVARPPAWLSPWARACAVAAGGQLGAAAWREGLVEALGSPEAVVRESAAWTLAWVGVDAASVEALKALERDPAPNVAGMARYALEAV